MNPVFLKEKGFGGKVRIFKLESILQFCTVTFLVRRITITVPLVYCKMLSVLVSECLLATERKNLTVCNICNNSFYKHTEWYEESHLLKIRFIDGVEKEYGILHPLTRHVNG